MITLIKERGKGGVEINLNLVTSHLLEPIKMKALFVFVSDVLRQMVEEPKSQFRRRGKSHPGGVSEKVSNLRSGYN